MKILWVLGLIFTFTACNKPQTNQGSRYPLPIRFAIAQAPLNLDPRYATDAASARVNRLIYQSPVDFDAQSKPVQSLASWLKISPTEYRFTLNKLHLFHNQTPLTAIDIKATYESLIASKDSPLAAEFINIKNIKAINTQILVFELHKADKNFPEKLIIGILPAHLIAEHHDFSHHPLGSGPLKFLSWQNALVLQRLSDKQIISLIEVKDPTVRVLKLLRGEVDLLQGDLPPELVKHLQTKPEITVKTNVGANFSYLGLNMQDPALQNLKVRQAISYAIDRNAIIKKVMVTGTRVARTILPPEHYTNQGLNQAELSPYEYNPVLAQKLLLEAHVRLPLKLVYKTSTDAQRVRLATIMQAQMQSAGIILEIRSLDWGTFFEEVKQGNFQIFGLTWVGLKTPEIYTKALGSQNFPPKGFNRGRYTDAELDKQLANEDWPAATVRMQKQLPYIPLWYEGQFAAMHKQVQGYAPKVDGNWDDLTTIHHALK